jgi:hypothetical protein
VRATTCLCVGLLCSASGCAKNEAAPTTTTVRVAKSEEALAKQGAVAQPGPVAKPAGSTAGSEGSETPRKPKQVSPPDPEPTPNERLDKADPVKVEKEKHTVSSPRKKRAGPPRTTPVTAPQGTDRPKHVDVLAAAPRKRASATLRSGALRFETSQSDSYWITYEAESGLQIAGLQPALGKRKLGARVSPFTQKSETGAIEHGGEIVALAVAAQLKRMGWIVDLASPEAMRKAARDIIPGSDLSGVLAMLDVSGKVSFTARSEGDQVVARLEGSVSFGSRRVTAATTATEPLKGGPRSAALEKTSKTVLRAFVHKIIADQQLSASLLSLVKAAKGR